MNKSLNIAIICDSIDTTLGGSYISAQRFAKGLTDAGHHIVWCASSFIDQEKRKEFGYATLYEFPSLFPLGHQKVRFAYPSVSHLIEIFKKEQIDIVYNIHPSYIGRQAYRSAKKLYLPIISHSHIYTQLLVPGLPYFLQKTIKSIIARFYRKCDGIIYPTVFAQQDFEEYKFKNREIVISNGVDTQIFHPLKKNEDAMFNILSVGRLDPEKNISMLLEVLRILKGENKINNIQCTIVGGGSEEKKLHTLVREYNIQDIVCFTGKYNQAEVIKTYQDCSVYVHTSLYELESMTTLEAMACGLPLLIADSRYSAARFFVKDNGYLFNSHHAKDLADKIYMLKMNPKIMENMKEKSVEYAASFSFETSIKKMSEFFISFCKKQ